MLVSSVQFCLQMSKLIDHCKAIVELNLGATTTRQRLQLADLFVEESSQDSETESENEFKISDDLLFKVLILLPAASLFSIQFVCKKWFSLINTSIFITSHSQQSPTIVICNCLTSLKFCDDEPHKFFRFLDLDNGGNSFVERNIIEPFIVQASCDGLILATVTNSNSLILINPITRKHIILPSSAETEHSVFFQSFGIGRCNKAKTYKIIHLFAKVSGAIACSMMSIRTRCWRSIKGPLAELDPDMRQAPVSCNGALYWLCSREGCDYFVCLSLVDEKFVSKNLPVIHVASANQLLEIGGCLGLATWAEAEVMQVWILGSERGNGEEWVKRYSIDVSGFGRFFRVVCCWRNGEGIVVEKSNGLFVYKFDSGETKVIHSSIDTIWGLRRKRGHIPHRNTLISLDRLL